MSDAHTPPINRRDALKVITAAAASAALAEGLLPATSDAQQIVSPGPKPKVAAAAPPVAGPRGTLTDPVLLTAKANWPRLLSATEMLTLASLCDMIIPADDTSPSASAVGAPAYINEYVSAPYEWAEKSLVRVRGGLGWLDVESQRRFTRRFVALTNTERTQICDDICFYPDARPQFKAAARFFGEIRNLAQSGFYTSAEGMKDLQYIGNVPLAKFEGPPPEVLKKLGLG